LRGPSKNKRSEQRGGVIGQRKDTVFRKRKKKRRQSQLPSEKRTSKEVKSKKAHRIPTGPEKERGGSKERHRCV